MGNNVSFKRKTRTKNADRQQGQSLVEFSIIFLILMLMLAGITEFGFLYDAIQNVQNASREGARFAVTLATLQDNDPRVIERIRDFIPPADLYDGFRDGITNNQIADCDVSDQVTVTISGDYHFVVLNLVGLTTLDLSFPTTMRYQLCE
jgi:Flp pilus assembly protein TadG